MMDSGYFSIMKKQIGSHIKMQNLSKYIGPKLISLISAMLTVKENKRYDSLQTIKHEYLKSYYKRYKDRVEINACTDNSVSI